MAFPLQTQLFPAFGGTEEGIQSTVLPDIFSSGGSQNVFVDKFGRIGRINGFARQNSAAYTTNGGSTAALVRGIIPYRSTSGGSISRSTLFVLDDGANYWELWNSTDQGATGTFKYQGGSTSVGTIPSAAQFGDTLYICNGKVVPRKWDGSSMSAVGLTQSPTITATDSSTTGNLTGAYQYKLISLIGNARQHGSIASSTLTLQGHQASLSWSQDGNGSVTGYEVYRTTGTGTTFYYLTTLSGIATTSYTDNTDDNTIKGNLVLPDAGDNPPTAYICVPHKSRMWWLRTDTNPTRGYWSDVSIPESVYAQNYIDFSDSSTVGDQITGGMGNWLGALVVFTEKAIWTVSGTGDVVGDIVDFNKVRSAAAIGACMRTMIQVPAGARYITEEGTQQTTGSSTIGYFTPKGDIRLFDGTNEVIISHPVKDDVGAFNYAQRTKLHVMDDSVRGQIIWFFPSAAATEPDTAVVWNYWYGVWVKWTAMNFSASATFETSSAAVLSLLGQASATTGAFIYQHFSGNSFDGSPIDARWMTKVIYGADTGQTEYSQKSAESVSLSRISSTKRWRWVELLFKVVDTVSLTVGWYQGIATDTSDAISTKSTGSSSITILTSSGSSILTASGSSIVVTNSSTNVKILLTTGTGQYYHDTGLRLRISTNDTNPAWFLEGMNLAYQVLPGQKRRES